jgi:hypothetical protein
MAQPHPVSQGIPPEMMHPPPPPGHSQAMIPQGDVGTSYYPENPHDLTGGLPINLDSLRDGPPGSKPFYPYSTLIRCVRCDRVYVHDTVFFLCEFEQICDQRLADGETVIGRYLLCH